MRRSRDEIRQLERDEAKTTGRSLLKVEDAKRRVAGEVEKRFQQRMAKIKALQDKKHDILRHPPLKETLLKYAKERLSAAKTTVIDRFLTRHLENCQKNSAGVPFDESTLKRTFEQYPHYSVLCFTEADIVRAISHLEEIGIPEEEREKMVKEIDQETASLYEVLEKEN
jgi:hypothetical protein